MNNQVAEKIKHCPKGSLDVHSIFNTIQGEGPYAGSRAVFVRLAGCNLQCPACDTEYTEGRRRIDATDLMAEVMVYSPTLVVLTGGEPFRQDFRDFARLLYEDGVKLQVETNGLLWWAGKFELEQWVSYVVSPKARRVCSAYLIQPTTPELGIDVSWKFVMNAQQVDQFDGLPTDVLGRGQEPCRPPYWIPNDMVYLQPEDSLDPEVNAANLKACVDSVMHNNYRLCVQLQKIIEVP